MAENGRYGSFESVINTFSAIMSAHRGEVVCEVTTAKVSFEAAASAAPPGFTIFCMLCTHTNASRAGLPDFLLIIPKSFIFQTNSFQNIPKSVLFVSQIVIWQTC
jgi:hypothetical protein